MGGTWKIINKVLNKTNNDNHDFNDIQIEGARTDDQTSVANAFNSFFVNIGPDLAMNIPTSSQLPFPFFST